MTDAPPRRPGDRVRLVVPENIALHGSLAVVASVEPMRVLPGITLPVVEPWFYLLVAPAAATGRFRALASEVESVGPELLTASPTGEVDDAPARKVAGHIPGNEGRNESAVDTPEDVVYVPPEVRYAPPADGIGEACVNCSGLNLRRAGSCFVCVDCGESQGCG
jgi:hypothetical protein